MKPVDWESVDWSALERLRDVFLRGATGDSGPYWMSAGDLESYDFTFGRRIAWKWAAVLQPLFARGWKPPASCAVDWGCGTGIAARSVLAYDETRSFSEAILWDHSPAATGFAERAIRARQPHVAVRVADPTEIVADGKFVLLVSHVLNELDPAGRATLLALARRAAAVLWVEPGTSTDSRALIAVREELRGAFHCLAPCPHDGACGMLAAGNERHWCHHFARTPTEAFTESGWSHFARRLGIDLRSLPYSHLVLDRRAPQRPEGIARLIGEPWRNGPLMDVLACRAAGVSDLQLEKRSTPALWRTLEKGRHAGTFAWTETDSRVVAGTSWPPSPGAPG